jgi:biotin-dependent carboxylase-like uncharacterized protein
MTRLLVKACGAMTTLQDMGRVGYQRFGLSPAGAMDPTALALANALVGNPPGTAAIELALLGAQLLVEDGDARIAVAGPGCQLEVDGTRIPPLSGHTARAGQSVSVGALRAGMYAYLAVAGGFDIRPSLGSLSLHLRAGLGGLDGRPIKAGDVLPLRRSEISGPELELHIEPPGDTGPIRVVLGPQDHLFTPAGIEAFLGSEYKITGAADRMGYRLSGPPIEHASGFNIISDGIVAGSIQVPGTREPIVMLADRQTTGGYPKIATIASADLGRFVQMRPGTGVRFTAIGRAEAVSLARARRQQLQALVARIRPAATGRLDSERLLDLNLAGDAVDAHDGRPWKPA